MKISVSFTSGPRNEAYCAVDSDTYDADFDGSRFFSSHPMGLGASPAEAIQDLLDQIADREEEEQMSLRMNQEGVL